MYWKEPFMSSEFGFLDYRFFKQYFFSFQLKIKVYDECIKWS